MKSAIVTAKTLVIVSFVVLLATTYTMRSQLINLIWHIIKAEDIHLTTQLDRFKEGKATRETEYEINKARFDKAIAEYLEQLRAAALPSSNDQAKDQASRYALQQQDLAEHTWTQMLSNRPRLGMSPETREQLATVHDDFRRQQMAYFGAARTINWLIGLCAIALVTGILFLLMFEPGANRGAYVVVLVLSFVFFIGPAFYNALHVVAWRLSPPDYNRISAYD